MGQRPCGRFRHGQPTNSSTRLPLSDPGARWIARAGYLSVVQSADLTPADAIPRERAGKVRSGREPSLRRHRALLLLCVSGAVVESVLVGLLGPRAALPLAPQATATAPYGVFHDLRWLLVYSHSWLTVGVESAGFLLVRGALTALTVHLAWPADAVRPRFPVLLRRCITF